MAAFNEQCKLLYHRISSTYILNNQEPHSTMNLQETDMKL